MSRVLAHNKAHGLSRQVPPHFCSARIWQTHSSKPWIAQLRSPHESTPQRPHPRHSQHLR